MTDARLRDLERRFSASGSLEDEAALLSERVRLGEPSQERLALAAYCGHAAAERLAGATGPDESAGSFPWRVGLVEASLGDALGATLTLLERALADAPPTPTALMAQGALSTLRRTLPPLAPPDAERLRLLGRDLGERARAELGGAPGSAALGVAVLAEVIASGAAEPLPIAHGIGFAAACALGSGEVAHVGARLSAVAIERALAPGRAAP